MNKQVDNNMKSPFTGGLVYLVEDTEVQDFRKEQYTVHVRYYECKDTGEQFTTEEQDEQLCNELYNQYRIRHGIPFPDEIKKIREHYGLSYSQITQIVGFGQNQWRQYENGSVPSESNGKSIVAIKSKEGMLAMLDSCMNQFDDKTFSKIRKHIPVFSCNLAATIQLPSQFLYIHPCHFFGQDIGNRLEEWHGDRLPVCLIKHDFCICQ